MTAYRKYDSALAEADEFVRSYGELVAFVRDNHRQPGNSSDEADLVYGIAKKLFFLNLGLLLKMSLLSGLVAGCGLFLSLTVSHVYALFLIMYAVALCMYVGKMWLSSMEMAHKLILTARER